VNAKSFWAFLKRAYSLEILKETFKEWSQDKATRLAAALAFYVAIALGPLIIGVLAIVGFVYSTQAAQEELMAQVNNFMGPQSAEVVQTIVENAAQPDTARLAGLLSLLVFFWSASNIFVQLQDALNTVWGVQLRPDLSFVDKAKHRLFPLLMVLGIGGLLLVAVVASSALSSLETFVPTIVPGMAFFWQALTFVISLVIITLLFGAILKVLPDVEITWGDVWPGAAFTALLFMVGQLLLSWYLGRQSGTSVYGAAGSLIVLLLWLYYSAQIFFFGAEYTQVYATRQGEGVHPNEDAIGRDEVQPIKAAAQVAKETNRRPSQRPAQAARMQTSGTTWVARGTASKSETISRVQIPIGAVGSPGFSSLSLGQLVDGLIDDWRTLWRKEIQLARTEMREKLSKAARGLGMAAGGGILLYTGFIVLMIGLPLVLLAVTVMPLWLAALLVGLLVLIEGALLARWGMVRLKQVRAIPKQTIETVREDVEVVKEHVGTQ
jgi:membrane protein